MTAKANRVSSIIIDDNRFDDWFVDDFSTVPVDLEAVGVRALDDQPRNPGLQYEANGEFSATGFDQIDVFFGSTVSTLDGSQRIKDNSLAIKEFVSGLTELISLINAERAWRFV